MTRVDPAAVPVHRVTWRPSYRLIPSRYPTVGLYDAIADPADLDVVFAIEALANPRLRDEIGELRRRARGASPHPVTEPDHQSRLHHEQDRE